jgi:NAD(P)-dependent dehydrogenase (short-subunit alcohol dehydrogenase family)
MKNLRGRVAVITGAASGFGLEFAKAGHKLGLKLVLADVQQDALDRAHAELTELGAEVLAMRCDVSKSEDVQKLADAAIARFGAVHLLFNNAGVGSGGLVWENTVADWEWVLGVNLWGVIHGIRIFTPLMLECAKKDPGYEGHIVNTASVAGLLNAPTMGIYSVSKHAVVSLSETLYHDLKVVDAPINVSVLCPYFVPTGIGRSDRNRPAEMQNETDMTRSQRLAGTLAEQSVNAGKTSAADVAAQTFDAIREGQFYIYTHPGILADVALRMHDLIGQHNPRDPYDALPEVRDLLRAKLRTH